MEYTINLTEMGFYTHFQGNNVGFFHRLKNNFILSDNLLFVSLWLPHYNTASVRDNEIKGAHCMCFGHFTADNCR